MTRHEFPKLINEPPQVKGERKGGAVNLALLGQIAEAGRMLNEGVGIGGIEWAARRAFGIPRGYLEQADAIGIENIVAALEFLSDGTNPGDAVFAVYHNFFAPPQSFLDRARSKGPQARPEPFVADPSKLDEPEDVLLMGLLRKRFQAVAFMTAAEVAEAGLLELADADAAFTSALGWREGPFAMMNRMGLEDSLRLVTERMELSHRNEINFPVPRLLIDQVGRRQPWPLSPSRED